MIIHSFSDVHYKLYVVGKNEEKYYQNLLFKFDYTCTTQIENIADRYTCICICIFAWQNPLQYHATAIILAVWPYATPHLHSATPWMNPALFTEICVEWWFWSQIIINVHATVCPCSGTSWQKTTWPHHKQSEQFSWISFIFFSWKTFRV